MLYLFDTHLFVIQHKRLKENIGKYFDNLGVEKASRSRNRRMAPTSVRLDVLKACWETLAGVAPDLLSL